MRLRIGILTFLALGLVSAPAQVTNPRPMRSTIMMLPATYAGETYNAMQFDPRADGILYLWPRIATEGGSTVGGTNVAGITNINGLTNANQVFAAGSSGTDFGISSSIDTHTFNLPTASSGARGALSSGDWSTFNNKQGAITVQTNGVTLASFPTTWNFGPGLTGYVSGGTVVLGNSVAGGGDVTTAQLLGVSNQVQVASNKFDTDVGNLQAATNLISTKQQGNTHLTNLAGNPYVQYTNIAAFQATNTTLTDLAGIAATNKVVFTNDAWLERLASNRVEVAAGSGISVASANSGNKQVFTVTASGGAGSPAGNAGAIQFNEGGAFAGTNDLYYDRTNGMGYLSGLTPSWTVYKLGSGVSTVRVSSSSIQLVSPSADPHLDIAARNDLGGISGGINIYTNRLSGSLSNHMALGSPTTYWNTSFVNVAWAAQAIQLGTTNGGSGTIFSNAGLWRPTNVIVLNLTNPTVGQVLKIARVDNLSGGMVVIGVTNDTDNTGGAGGGGPGSLPLNLNQFDTNGTASIKIAAEVTNLTVRGSDGAFTGLSVLGNTNNYFQINLKNASSGASASSDFVITADNGTETTHYANFGINSSGGGGAPFTTANHGYLYTIEDPLNIGALGGNSSIRLHVDGGTSPKEIARIETNGLRMMNAFILFSNVAAPSLTFPTNNLAVGKDSYAGRGFLESWDDNGLSIAYQPALMNNRVTMFMPSATTVIGSYGLTIPVNLGGVTVSHPPPTEEWPYMVQLATPATSNACAGTFSSIDMTTMGTRYGHSGYFFATEFNTTNLLNQHTKTAPEGNRLFIGRTSTANPNLTNIVNTTNGTGQYAGLYCDSGNTNQFYLTARDGTAEFRTNTGMLWVATNLYQFYMMQAPTSRMLAWKLKDLTSNTVSQGWFSNNVPTNMMKFGYLIRNGTTVVNSVRFSKIYVEAPLSP